MAAANLSDDVYEIWATIAKTTLIEKGLWDVVENGVPPDPELSATIQPGEVSKRRDLVRRDTEALQVLQSSLPDSVFTKIILSADSAKDVWDLLRKANEQAKLEKRFEELSMDEGETLDFYLDRVLETAAQFRRMKLAKSDHDLITKVLSSLSKRYENLAPLLEKVRSTDLKNMPLGVLVEFSYMYESITREATSLRLKNLRLESSSDKWCSVCSKSNHNKEDCKSVSKARQVRPRKNECFLCEERGHYARDCKRKHEYPKGTNEEEEEDEIVFDYVMAAPLSESDLIYDEDLWMVSGFATIHMTPYENVFTTLARTHKGKVGLVDGKLIMAEGKGDVKIVMKDGKKKKKTIENVLFVPEISRNVLSLSQLEFQGCSFREGGRGECIISDQVGAVFGDTVWDKKDMALRLQFVGLIHIQNLWDEFGEGNSLIAFIAPREYPERDLTFMAMAAAKTHDAVSDELNYEIWASIAKTTLVEKELWHVVENGVPPDPSKIPELASTIQAEEVSKWRGLAVKDMKALQILQSSLPDSAFRKTLSASSAKHVWDLLKEGNEEEAKLVELEKRFEELSMNKREPMDSYLDRVMEIVEQLRDSKIAKPDYEVITKVLGSLPMSYDCVPPLLDEYMDLKNTSLDEFVAFAQTFGSLPGYAIASMLKNMFDSPEREQKPAEVEEEYEMFALTVGDFKYDEDMWMIYTTTSNHMTPYVKFFTTLDRTHRRRIKLATGAIIMSEGRGDVQIMTKEGKRTIKNVLYVPAVNRNVLSVYQLTSLGYSAIMAGNRVFKFTIRYPNGKLLGEAMSEERGFFLRFQVIEGNLRA
ncbi:unnamed protein product [Microthlaspi erraticum]|uniref:CCHC-type domain-containing protein n=1 Tax=Microthlaspi erraticum TaxID=1685480 RepID=A0A6D2HE96_9BRAS|nr:unnamed protein product [Microthlaspi erraticum]